MKKTAIFAAVLATGMLTAQPWTENFETGLDEWKITPKASDVKIIDDPDGKYGKVLQISAQENTSGVNAKYIPIPADSAGKPWVIEFDIRSEGVTKGAFSVTAQYCNEKQVREGQTALLYVRPENDTYGWKHCRYVVGTGNRKLPAEALTLSVRFGYWNPELKCTGTVLVDNVKVTPPRKDSDLWVCDFESGLDQWKITPRASKIKLIEDSDTRYGKAVRISAEHDTCGMNTEILPIPAGTAGKPWNIEFDLRSEGNIQGSCTAVMQYFDAKGNRVGQHPLLYVKKEAGAYGWTHYKSTVGTGKRQIPKDAAKASLRFGFWNKELDCTGAIVVDNVKIQPPKQEQ